MSIFLTIQLFLDIKEKAMILGDKRDISRYNMFSADEPKKFNVLKLTLQQKALFEHKMWRHVK